MLIPFVIGLPFLIGAAITFTQVAIFVSSATKTEAIYAGSVAQAGGSHGGTFLYPRFRFITPDGRTVTITSTFGSTDQPYDNGEKVPVLCEPNHPEYAKVDSFQLWLTPLFLAPFGILLTGIPAIVFVAMKNRPSPPLPSRHIGF
ncbi:DUF3592 domain-containing protein [Acidisphaera sp. S103]|uniref:DUF3592 domain-containing protein n=1 Tax=Acidisphaera sp. S103 TaxID=1747223 RepID=UPI00131CD7D7|nr:DUF3592 domain-containing protein [Acidisphaera sp. S103]